LLDLTPLRRSRELRLLYFGQLVSFVGSMVTYVAVPWQVWQLTRSSFLVGLLGGVQLVPLVAFGLFGGAVADSLDRRKLMVFSELALALGSLGLAVNAALPKPSVLLVFALAAV